MITENSLLTPVKGSEIKAGCRADKPGSDRIPELWGNPRKVAGKLA
jgi:hypothetical protein